jgi:hypothetical protein
MRGRAVPGAHDGAAGPSVEAGGTPKLVAPSASTLAGTRWRWLILGPDDRAALGMWAVAHLPDPGAGRDGTDRPAMAATRERSQVLLRPLPGPRLTSFT